MTGMSRRELLTMSLLAAPALLGLQAAAADRDDELQHKVAELERRNGGRLGVAVLNTASMKRVAYRGDERFAMCSTSKFAIVALVLARVDRKQESLSRRIVYGKNVLIAHSPITEEHVGDGGMSVGEICQAAITVSDNAAANLLIDSFGGPTQVTAYLRSIGDNVTRLDRREPELNEDKAGDPRDTTTPNAMLDDLLRIVLGNALSVSSREQLTAWLIANTTGDQRLRAGVPKGWRVGDKTGSGENNATNDIAVLWPPQRAPILVSAYYDHAPASEDQRNAVLAEVGQLASRV